MRRLIHSTLLAVSFTLSVFAVSSLVGSTGAFADDAAKTTETKKEGCEKCHEKGHEKGKTGGCEKCHEKTAKKGEKAEDCCKDCKDCKGGKCKECCKDGVCKHEGKGHKHGSKHGKKDHKHEHEESTEEHSH